MIVLILLALLVAAIIYIIYRRSGPTAALIALVSFLIGVLLASYLAHV